MEKDLYFLEKAYEEAVKAYEKDEVPVGAVIVKNDKIIGKGHNLRKKEKDPFLHGEICAIKDASKNLGNWRLDDSTIYVTLEPCLMCVGAILQSRIKRLVFGALDKKGGCVCSNLDINSLNLPFKLSYEYIPHEKSSQILKQFFKEKRKK